MNVHLTYRSGQSYSEHLSNFQVTVKRRNSKRVTCSFREKEASSAYAAFSLPIEKARQLAHAILASAAAEDVNPIQFEVEEASRSQTG